MKDGIEQKKEGRKKKKIIKRKQKDKETENK